jgi:DNA polymerase III epsilon subunit-like protein
MENEIHPTIIEFHNRIKGKNILIFDTETTGLPERKQDKSHNEPDKYYNPTDNSKYDNSRIVQIAWAYIENFDSTKITDVNNLSIQSFIRKPINNEFNIGNSAFHGITNEIAIKDGVKLSEILNKHGLSNRMKEADFIIAYNALFDIAILSNELHRLNFTGLFNVLKNKFKNKQIICAMRLWGNIFNKRLSLNELYKQYYNGQDNENMHNAKYDIIALIEILHGSYITKLNDKNIKLNTYLKPIVGVDNVMIFDIETDGHDAIVEIAYYICDQKLEIYEKHDYFLIHGKPIVDMNRKISRHTILKYGIHPKEVLKRFFTSLSKCKYICGHNIKSFDLHKINAYCEKYNVKYEICDVVDTLTVSRKHFGKTNKNDLKTIYTKFCNKQMDRELSHTALYDVQITHECMCSMLNQKLINFSPGKTLFALYEDD